MDLLLISIKFAFCFKICSICTISFEIRIQNKRRTPSHEFGFNTTGACGLDVCYDNNQSGHQKRVGVGTV